MLLFLFRMFAILVAGSVLGAGSVRIAQWYPLRKRVGIGPTLFFCGAVVSAISSLFYRITAIEAHAAFSARDAISTIVLLLFLGGLTASPTVLAELETREGGEHGELP